MIWKTRVLLFIILYTNINLATCFNRPLSEQGRRMKIIGGKPAILYEAPHHVQVHGKYLCGGSLVTKQHVLTSLHCLDLSNTNEPVQVIAGSINKHQNNEVQEATYYKGTSKNNLLESSSKDVAILKLKSPFTKSTIDPVPLLKYETQIGEEVTVFGYGRLGRKKKSFSDTLQKFKATVVKSSNDKTCVEPVADSEDDVNDETGVCIGDNGGGVINSRGQLIGVYYAHLAKKQPCFTGKVCFRNLYNDLEFIKKYTLHDNSLFNTVSRFFWGSS